MRQELEAKLIADFPELYKDAHSSPDQSCMAWGFECGDGWYDLIYTLSESLMYEYHSAKSRVEFLKNNLDKQIRTFKPITQEDIDKAISDMESIVYPVAAQVKEKFGGLRFYIDNGTDKHYNYIDFAERMSHKICEVCGSPGKLRPGSYVRTLCEMHSR